VKMIKAIVELRDLGRSWRRELEMSLIGPEAQSERHRRDE
jgi:hypothetical protein